MKTNFIEPLKLQLENQPNLTSQLKESENLMKKDISSMFRANDRMLQMIELKYDLMRYRLYKASSH